MITVGHTVVLGIRLLSLEVISLYHCKGHRVTLEALQFVLLGDVKTDF